MNITELNKLEAMRYMGVANTEDELTNRLLAECEAVMLQTAQPRYVYKTFDITPGEREVKVNGTNLVLTGTSIAQHLAGCEKAVLMAVTLSESVDRLIRVTSIKDMAKACVLDSLASVMVEQVCEEIEKELSAEYEGYYQTFRFGLGYGDLPLELQGAFLKVLDAPKRIGLNVTGMNLMTPSKSVTCVTGLSKTPVSREKRGCQSCNLKGNCRYRKDGSRCNV